MLTKSNEYVSEMEKRQKREDRLGHPEIRNWTEVWDDIWASVAQIDEDVNISGALRFTFAPAVSIPVLSKQSKKSARGATVRAFPPAWANSLLMPMPFQFQSFLSILRRVPVELSSVPPAVLQPILVPIRRSTEAASSTTIIILLTRRSMDMGKLLVIIRTDAGTSTQRTFPQFFKRCMKLLLSSARPSLLVSSKSILERRWLSLRLRT